MCSAILRLDRNTQPLSGSEWQLRKEQKSFIGNRGVNMICLHL